jgi:hypothetical protein
VHIGTLYVSFTENDPDKTMYNACGELIPLIRNNNVSSQVEVAEAALHVVCRRKRQIVMTPFGKFAYFAYTFFPVLSEILIAAFARKSRMYAVDDIFK